MDKTYAAKPRCKSKRPKKSFRQHISNLSCVKVMSVLSIKGVFYLANVSLSALSEKTRAANICRIAIVQLCCGILAFSTARTVVFENYSPFGVAFLCAVPGEYSLVSIIGCIVGSILRTGGDSVRYITACIFALALKWGLYRAFQAGKTKHSGIPLRLFRRNGNRLCGGGSFGKRS